MYKPIVFVGFHNALAFWDVTSTPFFRLDKHIFIIYDSSSFENPSVVSRLNPPILSPITAPPYLSLDFINNLTDTKVIITTKNTVMILFLLKYILPHIYNTTFSVYINYTLTYIVIIYCNIILLILHFIRYYPSYSTFWTISISKISWN